MVLNIDPGYIAVPTPNNTGSTLCRSDAVETVTLDPAPASGQNRIDLVICRPRGTDLDGGVNNDFIFDKVTGTAAASPVAPALPAGTVALASVYVGGGVAAIVAGNITDTRPFGLALAGGAARAPYTGAGIGSYTAPDGEVWVAKAGVNGGAWRKARDVLHARWFRNAAFTMATAGQTVLSMDTTIRDSYGLYTPGNGAVTVPVSGVWMFSAMTGASATAVGQFLQHVYSIVSGGAIVHGFTVYSSVAAGFTITSAFSRFLNAGDQIALLGRATVAMNGLTGEGNTNFNATYMGTG